MNEKREQRTESKPEAKRRVGPFELERKLGVGGMGVVYLATYLKNGRKMAVKVLAPEMSADKRLLRRFLREMSILSKLRHENIVRYFGGGKDKTQHFYAMEYMDGGSIEQVLKKKGRFTWEETIAYAKQISLALEYSHNAGIIHRDLKPANLFLGRDGRLKLGDFGIARDTQATALTAAGRTVGTYAYMAPEQIAGKPPISRKTDLYALGCVMFEMLTGKPPFSAPSAAEMLFAHLEQEPPRVTSAALDCPVWLDNIIAKLLEKDPEERFYDALALQVELDSVAQKMATQESMAKQTVSGGNGSTVKDASGLAKALSGKKKKKKKKAVPFYERIWFLAGCLAALIVFVGWMLLPRSDAELFAHGSRLMQSKDSGDWDRARTDYFEPLLRKSPDGPYAVRAREYLDQIEMDLAERQATTTMRLNRNPRTEAERHFIEALRFEQFKDRISAMQKYTGLIELMKDSKEDRPYVNLARKKLHEIEESGGKGGNVVSFVNENLKRADEFATKGEPVEAQKIWRGVITLYSDNRELERQVSYARARLGGERTEPMTFGIPTPRAQDENPKGKP